VIARWTLCVLLAVVGAFPWGYTASAQQRADAEIEILSKADAIRLFALTKDQWLGQIRTAVAAGAATQTGGDRRIPGMSTTTPEGDLLTIRLDYSKGDAKPVFIQVVIGYRPPRAKLFNDRDMPEFFAAVQRQMAPEFEVVGSAERIEGGLGIFFSILEKGR
jgi:hypothetical protein